MSCCNALISSVSRTGKPVMPNDRSGYELRMPATISLMPLTLSWSAVNEPAVSMGRVKRNASLPSPLKKYCGTAIRSDCSGDDGNRLCHGFL